MNDDVFNTLMAVALMCNSHFAGPAATEGNDGLLAPDTKFERGFEQCAGVIEQVRLERERRAFAEARAKQSIEKERLANAVAALEGKHFDPEPAPPPKSQLSDCMNPIPVQLYNGTVLGTPEDYFKQQLAK